MPSGGNKNICSRVQVVSETVLHLRPGPIILRLTKSYVPNGVPKTEITSRRKCTFYPSRRGVAGDARRWRVGEDDIIEAGEFSCNLSEQARLGDTRAHFLRNGAQGAAVMRSAVMASYKALWLGLILVFALAGGSSHRA